MNKLDCKIILNHPGEKPSGAVIWLHGLGADYNDFVPIVSELKLPLALKFIFPNAPVMPVTINNGFQMRAWYNILDMSDLHREVDANGILHSIAQINNLIEGLLVEGFTHDQIVIAGFSQGGVISYYSGLNCAHKLAGILILSSYLPDISLINVPQIKNKIGIPILICHGTQDPVVNIAYAKNATKYLTQLGLSYEWHEYPMPHSVCFDEIQAISRWLQKIYS